MAPSSPSLPPLLTLRCHLSSQSLALTEQSLKQLVANFEQSKEEASGLRDKLAGLEEQLNAMKVAHTLSHALPRSATISHNLPQSPTISWPLLL